MPDVKPARARAGAVFAAFIAGLALVISTLSAQQADQADSKTAEQQVVGPEPIAAADMPRNAETIRARIREMTAALDRVPQQVEEVGKDLPVLEDEVSSMLDDPAFTDLDKLSSRDLQGPRQSWLQVRERIVRLRSALDGYVGSLDGQRQELRESKAVWDVTKELAIEQDYPQALHETIDLVVSKIEEMDGQLRDRLGDIVTLQNKLSEEDSKVSEMIAAIDQAMVQKQQRIFRPDSAPLWAVFTEPVEERQPALEFARESWGRVLADFSRYFFDHFKLVLLHLLIFGAFAAFMISQRKRRDAQAAIDPTFSDRTRVFESPLSGAFVVSLVASQAIYEDPPNGFVLVTVIISLVPLARALPRVLPEFLHRTAYFIVAIMAIFLVREVTLDTTLFDRLTLLTITGLGAWYVLSRMKFYRAIDKQMAATGTDPEGLDTRVIRFAQAKGLRLALRIILAVLLLSAVANIAGSVEFSDTLTRGMLIATFITILLYVAYDVLSATWRIILRTDLAQAVNSIRRYREKVRDSGIFVLKLGAFVLVIIAVSQAFNMSVMLAGLLKLILNASLQVGAIDISLGKILTFVFAIWLTLFIARVVKIVLTSDILVRTKLPRGVPATISTLVNYVIFAVGFFAAFAAAGIELGNLTILAGALGVGIGFGLQNIVNNFVSGLILIFERPIQVGDVIQLTDLMGRVRHIGIRASTVRTFEGAEVIVPNANLISTEVINWTLSDKERRIEIIIGVSYGTDPSKVIELLSDTVAKHESVLSEPEPQVLFTGFGDSSLDFAVRCWTPDADTFLITKSDLCVAINNVLAENDIVIPFPQRDLHLRSVDESAGKNLAEMKKSEKLGKTPTARRKGQGSQGHHEPSDVGSGVDGGGNGGGDT